MTDVSLFIDQLRLASTAAAYDLRRPEERSRSSHDLVSLFYDLQVPLRPSVFGEIGAFDAKFSRDMKAAYPGSRVVAFEGNPQNAAHCSGLHDFEALGVEYLASLVSDVSGAVEMMIQAERRGRDPTVVKRNDSILPRAHPGVAYAPQLIPSVTLDDFFGKELDQGGSFSLWIDVEGAAQLILAGATRVISKTRSLLIEVEEHAFWENQWLFDDVHAFLGARGFTAIARDFEYEHQFNVLYIDAPARKMAAVRASLALYASRIHHGRS